MTPSESGGDGRLDGHRPRLSMRTMSDVSRRLVVIGAARRGTRGRRRRRRRSCSHRSGAGRSTSTDPGAVDLHPIAGNFKPDETKLADCHEQLCFEQAFGNVAYYTGPKAAINALRASRWRRTRRRGRLPPDRAHDRLSASLVRFHGDIPKAFAQGRSICWSGYYHGILERAFCGVSTEAGLIKAARGVCSSAVAPARPVAPLPVRARPRARTDDRDRPTTCRSRCTSATSCQTPWDQTSCTGGVYMENVNAANGTVYGGKTPWLKASDLVYPCDAPVTKGQRLYCYLMVTSRVLAANGYDCQGDGQGLRAGVEKPGSRRASSRSGATRTARRDRTPCKVKALCKLAGRWEVAVHLRRRPRHDLELRRRPRPRCSAGRSTRDFRAYCFEGIGTILGTLHAEDGGRDRAVCST